MPPAFFLMCLLSPMPFGGHFHCCSPLVVGGGVSAHGLLLSGRGSRGGCWSGQHWGEGKPAKQKTSPKAKRITTAQLVKQLSSVAALLPQLSQQLTRASSLLFRPSFEEAGVAIRASCEGAPRTLSRAVSYAAFSSYPRANGRSCSSRSGDFYLQVLQSAFKRLNLSTPVPSSLEEMARNIPMCRYLWSSQCGPWRMSPTA